MTPWRKKKKSKHCSCCIYWNKTASDVCDTCQKYDRMIADLEQRHREFHEEEAMIRGIYGS